MKMYDKLIVVDKENTSVGLMAEAIVQKRFLLEDILVESRGLVVLFPEPVNPKVEAILASHGMTMKGHTSRQIEPGDFDERTLILTMESSQGDKLRHDYREAVNVYSFKDYIGTCDDIIDPYGGTLADYGSCFEQLEKMTERLAYILKQEEK